MKKTTKKTVKKAPLLGAISTKKKLFAKDYNTRQELQIAVGNMVSLNPDPKDYELLGTRKELARLQLSDRTTFYGISCVIGDTPTEIRPQVDKPVRGKRFEHGINLNQ